MRQSRRREGACALIVDDEPEIVAALTDLLEDDYRIVSETSPRAALALLREDEDISAILCDQRMPRMTGDEFFAAARELSAASRILVTGYADLEAVVRAVNEGKIFGYVTKPWDANLLRSTVRSAVEQYELTGELERERALFDDLMRSVSDGVFFKDAAGRFMRLNEAEAGVLNLRRPADAIGRTLYELLPEEVARAWSEEEAAILSEGRSPPRTLRTVTPKNGAARTYAVDIAAVRGAGGAVEGVVGISRDVTEEQRVQKMKGEFISTVSHELRTPLTSIQGSLSLLRSGVVGELPKGAMDLLEIGCQNSARLLRLINDILDIDRLDRGALRLELGLVDIGELLEAAVSANAGYGQPDGKVVEIAEPAPRVRVLADRDRLLQVLANLISNAFKFSPPGAHVRLRAAVLGDSVRVSVIDRGCGVPREFRTRIFQRFSQADSTDSRKKGGAGLGLSISRSIIELHGGRINYRTRLNVGTKFFFDLPVHRDAPRMRRAVRSEEQSSGQD